MKNPRLKQRKTKWVAGWLTRDSFYSITLWDSHVGRDEIRKNKYGCWRKIDGTEDNESGIVWKVKDFKSLYTGIPRRGRAVYVQMEIVVE